jgi:mersacidin/lichenicidin family type 2 lantibiotic
MKERKVFYMKFDIVRAWKDEAYRRNLSEEQRDRLPANPAGELTDAEMGMVYGGGGGMGSGGGGGGMPVTPAAPAVGHGYHFHRHSSIVVGTTAASAAASSESHTHSWSLLCDLSLFSVNLIQVQLIPIASPLTQCCEESH